MNTCTVLPLVILVTGLLNYAAIKHFDLAQYLPTSTPNVLLITMTLSFCYLIWCRHRFVSKFNATSHRAITFGIIGHLPEVFSCVRSKSMSIISHEFIACLPLLNASNQSGFISIFIGPIPVMWATTPETVQAVMTHKQMQAKGATLDLVRFVTGDGLLTLKGDRWSQHRKLLTPAFHIRSLKSLVPIVRNKTQAFMSRMKEIKKPVTDAQQLISRFSLEVLCRSSMGIDISGQLASEMTDNLHLLYEAFAVVSTRPWMRFPCLARLYQVGRDTIYCTGQLTALAQKVISQRIELWRSGSLRDQLEREEESTSKSREVFIDIMIREYLQNPKAFSMQDILDETRVFLIAGHDTTATAINYTLLMIGHHPQVQARIHGEIDLFFTDHSDEELTLESLNNFVYTEAVINETLRMHPPVPLTNRAAEADIEINGQQIPKGTEMVVFIQWLHMDAKYWPDPHRFKPERFLDKQHHPFAFLPFSAGPRMCIGYKYAMASMKTFIILMLKHYTVKSISHYSDIASMFAPVATPIEPLKYQFIKRS